jgi:hypothetical protein
MACYVLESSECGSSGQILIRAWACSWSNCLRQSGLPHHPRLHLLISGANKPCREAYRVEFGFRSQGRLWSGRMVKKDDLRLLI